MSYEDLTLLESLLNRLSLHGTTKGDEIKKVRGAVNRIRGQMLRNEEKAL